MTDKNSMKNIGIISKPTKIPRAKSSLGSLESDNLSIKYNANNANEGISIEIIKEMEENVMIF